MFNVKIPMENSYVPFIEDKTIKERFERVKSTYEDANVTEKKIAVAILLEKICANNYENGGHWFVETKDLYDGTDQDFYSYVVRANGNPQTAVNMMCEELMMFASYSSDIEGTEF